MNKKSWRSGTFKVIDNQLGEIYIFPIGLFIKDLLLKYGEVYPNQVYSELRRIRRNFLFTGEVRVQPKRGFGSYQVIKNYFYWLTKLGLIEKSKKVTTKVVGRGSGLRPKGMKVYYQYYRLTPKGKTEEEMWVYPPRALYKRRGKTDKL